MKLSIILPVYNTGNYLHKCIKSILAQTMSDFELIIVDDGSKDNSGEICDEYAKSDNRVTVIHKKNEGVSIARNTGISASQGEFIGFIDSDDWIESDMYESLYSHATANNCDVVMCDAVTKYDDSQDEPDTITQLPDSILLKKTDITPGLLCEMAGAAWRCIYKRDLLLENNIYFPAGIPFSEDRIFNILAMGYAHSIYYTKEAYYNRYVRAGSAVNKYYKNMIDLVLTTRTVILDAIGKVWNSDEGYVLAYENQTLNLVFSAINNEFMKDAEGSYIEKYRNIKNICQKDEVLNAIHILKRNDLRSRLVLRKRAFLLSILAIAINKKHGR